ncbi:MAG: hypothetical protein IPK85_03250 [Gemmatimonadetes bacterium]|nr:hypothetical protein [Gemmatimonadota bacterium]
MSEEDALRTAVMHTSVYWDSVLAGCDEHCLMDVEVGGYRLGGPGVVALYVHLMECVNGEGIEAEAGG